MNRLPLTSCQPMDSERRKAGVHILVLFGLCLFFFFWRIGDLNLFGTEAHRALPAQTMLDTHEWWIPRLMGKPYLMKPPLSYWLIAVFSAPKGKVTETSSRLPSAFSATFLVLLIYWFARQHIGTMAGFLSGLITLTSGLIFEKAIAAEIDMNLTLWVTASLLFVYNALEREEKKLAYTLAAYVSLSMAFLSKGPPALVFLGSTLIVFLIWEKRLRFLWSPRHIFSFLAFVVIVLLWLAIVVSKVGWSALMRSGGGEFASRITDSTPFRLADIFYYPIGILGAFFPWSLFLPLAFLPSYYRSLSVGQKRLHRFLSCGVLANLILFSTVAGKENRYLVPMYPLMVLIMGAWWSHLLSNPPPRHEWYLKNVSRVLFAGLSCAAATIIAQPLLNVPRFHPSALLFLGLSGVSIVGLLFSMRANYRGVFISVLLLFVFYKLIFAFDFVPYKNNLYSIQTIARELDNRVDSAKVLYTVGFDKPNIFFYMRHPVVELANLSRLYAKATGDDPIPCMLTIGEIRRLRERYCLNLNVLYEFDTTKDRITLVTLDANEGSP